MGTTSLKSTKQESITYDSIDYINWFNWSNAVFLMQIFKILFFPLNLGLTLNVTFYLHKFEGNTQSVSGIFFQGNPRNSKEKESKKQQYRL